MTKKFQTKIQFQGYPIVDNQRVQDTNVLEYEFRNLGNTHVFINGIQLLPSGRGDNFTVFREFLVSDSQKTYGDYEIIFRNIDLVNVPINYLLVIEKRIVE